MGQYRLHLTKFSRRVAASARFNRLNTEGRKTSCTPHPTHLERKIMPKIPSYAICKHDWQQIFDEKYEIKYDPLDFEKLLLTPTKTTARPILHQMIVRWLEKYWDTQTEVAKIVLYPIAKRHGYLY